MFIDLIRGYFESRRQYKVINPLVPIGVTFDPKNLQKLRVPLFRNEALHHFLELKLDRPCGEL